MAQIQIQNREGKLRIYFPRSLSPLHKKFYLSLGLDANDPLNMAYAEKLKQEITLDILSGKFDPSLSKYRFEKPAPTLTLQESWKSYLEEIDRNVCESTMEGYLEIDRRLKKAPRVALSEPQRLLKWLKAEYSQDTVKRTVEALKRALELNAVPGWEDLALAKKMKRSKNRELAFTRLEVLEILDALREDSFCSPYARVKHSHYFGFVKFLFLTGFRLSEAVALQWEQVQESSIRVDRAVPTKTLKLVFATKTGKVREFPMNQALKDLLNSLDRQTPFVFPSSQKNSFIHTPSFRRNVWNPILRNLATTGKIRKPLSVYHTRHTFISHCLDQGLPVATVAEWVGNSPETIMKHYLANVSTNYLPPEIYS